MTELSDKVLGYSISTIGGAGILTSVLALTDNPKDIALYCGAVASAGCLGYGIRYLKKVYSNQISEDNKGIKFLP